MESFHVVPLTLLTTDRRPPDIIQLVYLLPVLNIVYLASYMITSKIQLNLSINTGITTALPSIQQLNKDLIKVHDTRVVISRYWITQSNIAYP